MVKALQVLTAEWEIIMSKVPGSFAPRVERLPDERILFSVSCGTKRGSGRITVQVALEAEIDPAILALVSEHVRRELTAICPHSRKFLP